MSVVCLDALVCLFSRHPCVCFCLDALVSAVCLDTFACPSAVCLDALVCVCMPAFVDASACVYLI